MPVMENFISKGFVIVLGLASLCSAVQVIPTEIHNPGVIGSTTSSTLGWVSSSDGEQPPKGAVQISEDGNEVWCRSEKHGQWVAGAVKNGTCHFPFLKSVYESTDYQTLVSINGSAYLKHTKWNIFSNFPNSGVSTSSMILAISKDEESGLTLPGFVNIAERQLYFLKEFKELVSDERDAILITEVEPKEYELVAVVTSDEKAKKEYKDEVKADIYLENTSTQEKLVSSLEDYEVILEQHWGGSPLIKGAITGTPFSVPSRSDAPKSTMLWGTYNDGKFTDTQNVSYLLPPGAAVKGKLIAKMRTLTVPYTASLTALYDDNSQMTRPIAANLRDTRMAELRVDFESPFNLVDNQPIESYNETSSVLRFSTTTTTTTTTTSTTGLPPDDHKSTSAQYGVSGSEAVQSRLLSLLVLVGSLSALLSH